jgi:type II secretory pathway pseudopilin PulG
MAKRIVKPTLAGFTLIELLVSITLLFGLLLTAAFGYRLFNQQWQRNLSGIDKAFAELHQNDMLSSALRGITPYMVREGTKNGFYFLGDAKGFTAVTVSPIFHVGEPAVIRILRELQPDGTWQLVYEEASLRNIALVEAKQQLPFDYRLIAMTGLPDIQFSYFAAAGFDQQAFTESETVSFIYQWFENLDGIDQQKNPEKIKINLGGFEWQLDMAARATLLQNRAAISQEVL